MSPRAIAARTFGAALLALLALVLVLAAHDVFAWSGQNTQADVAVARFSRDPGVWQPSTWLPTPVSRLLLGTTDDVRFGRALQRLQTLRGRRPATGSYRPPGLELAQLELTFDDIAHSDEPAAVRSRAQQLHAILLFQQTLLQGTSGDTIVATLERTIRELQEAVRLDPANADAQYDLEALMNIYRPIALERTNVQLNIGRGARGNTVGGGGSPGATLVAGGF